jgi:hypothetical protein
MHIFKGVLLAYQYQCRMQLCTVLHIKPLQRVWVCTVMVISDAEDQDSEEIVKLVTAQLI